MLHEKIGLGDIHRLTNWEVVDAVARNALVVTASDVGKVCKQGTGLTSLFYVLDSVSPSVWVLLNTSVALITTDSVAEGAVNLYYTDARARTAAVEDALVDGVTNKAPSQNAVFDALAAKENTGVAASLDAAHTAAVDPHPQYTTLAEASAASPVQSVAGKTGAVTLAPADVGLGNVDNTSDLNKPVSTATQTALNLKQDTSAKGAVNGYASLDSSILVPAAQLGVGTPSSDKFLNGDRVWSTPPGGGGGGGVGMVLCFDENNVQDDIPVTTSAALTTLEIQDALILGQTADIYQNSNGNYGWEDLMSFFTVRASGPSTPSYEVLWTDGSGLDYEGYTFLPNTRQYVMCDYHVHHDIALSTVMYPHIHWMPITNATGTVRWGFKFSVAKGHQQGADSVFPNGTTVYVEQTVSVAKNREHHLAEVAIADAIPTTRLEPDTVIKVIIFRDATHPNDTFPDKVHAWQADMHYQAGRLTTLNKAPNFYA